MQENMTKTEDKRDENRIQFERQLEEDRRQLEEKREQERREREENVEQRGIEREERIERQQQELEDKRVREQREYEKKREKGCGEAPTAVRQSEKEFNSQLLVRLFAVKKDQSARLVCTPSLLSLLAATCLMFYAFSFLACSSSSVGVYCTHVMNILY